MLSSSSRFLRLAGPFGRLDEILYSVEYTPGLSLPIRSVATFPL